MDPTWLELVEIHLLDWDRSRRVAGDDMRRLINEVNRLREVIQDCDSAKDLKRVKSIIRVDRASHKY
jgi:hypothetical protein